MPIYRVKGWWYARVEKGGKKWTPKQVGMTPARWKRKNEAKLGEAELRRRVDRLKTTRTSLDLLTLCNKYLDDALVSYVGHDTFALKKRLCKELLKLWGNIPCEKITVHMAQSYLLGKAERVSNNSFNVYRQEGSKLFEWGIKQELLPGHLRNPFAAIQKKRHEKKQAWTTSD